MSFLRFKTNGRSFWRWRSKMNGSSGDVGCEGMSIDGDESVGMGIDVEVDDSREGIGDECKDGTVTGIGGAECEDTDIGTVKGLGVDYGVNPLDYGQLVKTLRNTYRR